MKESKKIKVYLDDKPISIFKGMKVKHVLSYEVLEEVKKGIKIITDEEGHERGLEGSLTDGEKIYIKVKNEF